MHKAKLPHQGIDLREKEEIKNRLERSQLKRCLLTLNLNLFRSKEKVNSGESKSKENILKSGVPDSSCSMKKLLK